jgi:dephospho-CoA kinase
MAGQGLDTRFQCFADPQSREDPEAMIHVGITGGPGAGKTAALKVFADLGARTLDADTIVHRLYEPGSALCSLFRERGGPAVLTPSGGADRAAVAAIVFASESELAWLNRMVHPRVRRIIQDEMTRPGPPLFCAVPLLYEAGWEQDWPLVAAVWCDAATQRKRLHRRGWSDEQIDRRLARQLSMDEKLTRSDIGIINTGSLELLVRQCRSVYRLATAGHAGQRKGQPT